MKERWTEDMFGRDELIWNETMKHMAVGFGDLPRPKPLLNVDVPTVEYIKQLSLT